MRSFSTEGSGGVSSDARRKPVECRAAVAAVFEALGFAEVELDPAGYRRGGLL